MELYLKDIKPFVRHGIYRVYVGARYNDVPLKTKDNRLFYVVSGEGAISFGAKTHKLTAGSLVLFKSGTEYRWNVGDMQVCIVNFDYTFSARDKERSSPIPSAEFNNSGYEPHFTFPDMQSLDSPVVLNGAFLLSEKVKELVAEIHINDSRRDELLSSLMRSLLITIARMHESEINEESKSAGELAKRIITYIQTHFTEEISNEDIAEAIHYNSSYIGRVFRKYTGKTMHGFILEQRLENAKEKLSQEGYTVYEAAISSGFSDMPHFSKIFKKYVGLSPAAYRQKHRIKR